ncbi:N-acetylneuraminate synthase [Halomicrobium salinisoli]|uniref:N-acetylneuraminate synthase n=1 Tax=Halomicrobium salinisoli TaxID=2878391 RepID=UPI001CF0160A|nr:N-acetylneuraminate synthase [Halomicrobium salinisoli]
MRIDGTPISDRSVYFIAEAGVNHNGDLQTARRLIDAAVESGADAVKFQSYVAEELVASDAPKAEYQDEAVEEKSQLEMLREYELSRDEQRDLMSYCDEVGITFLSTPFDRESAAFLDECDVDAIKIGSGELNNYPLLETVAAMDRPAIVSTGMATMSEVVDAYEIFAEAGTDDQLVMLHCTSSYPASIEHVNLRSMRAMDDALPIPIGYSDHTQAVETPALAVAAGATVIEKHLTLDRSMEGPDHQASMEPDDLSESISLARTAAVARGRPDKRVTPPEEEIKFVARKGLYAREPVEAGQTFTRENVAIKRPARGLPPTEYETVLGSRAATTLERDDPITEFAVDSPESE